MCAPDLPGATFIRLVEVSGRDFGATKHGRTHSCNLESRGAVAVVDIEEARRSIISIITLRLSPRLPFVDRGRVRSERCVFYWVFPSSAASLGVAFLLHSDFSASEEPRRGSGGGGGDVRQAHTSKFWVSVCHLSFRSPRLQGLSGSKQRGKRLSVGRKGGVCVGERWVWGRG